MSFTTHFFRAPSREGMAPVCFSSPILHDVTEQQATSIAQQMGPIVGATLIEIQRQSGESSFVQLRDGVWVEFQPTSLSAR